MSREIDRSYLSLEPTRSVDFSGYGSRWTTTRVAPTRNAPFAGLAALPPPRGPCTANQGSAEKVMAGWVSLWDTVVTYTTLSKATRDKIWADFQAAETWFDGGFSAGGVWCARKEDLDAYSSALEQAKGALAGEVAARGLLQTAVKPTTPTTKPPVVLPEEQITAVANWWGLTVGVAAAALATVLIARRQRRGEDLSGCGCEDEETVAFRGRYARGR